MATLRRCVGAVATSLVVLPRYEELSPLGQIGKVVRLRTGSFVSSSLTGGTNLGVAKWVVALS